MTRSVVFKTPGKLDLRSIMTFGLNAKPNTGHPIGFFGTGLKYAIAVLVRNKIPVTFYIDSQKWSIDTEDSTFRDKTITEVFLTRHRKLMPPVHKKLPFTTELGKTWELWQAFRELESNTRDEDGDTFVVEKFNDHMNGERPRELKGQTWIAVESEKFVQEYQDRAKTFLPEGLTLREGSEDVQVFDRPSKHIYYRGIRVLDLEKEEVSQLTYNILREIDLTEDRTAKSKWDVEYAISNSLGRRKDPEIVRKVVSAPKGSFEAGLTFYQAPSKEFLDVVEAEAVAGNRNLNHNATSVHRQYRPPKAKAQDASDWYTPLIDAITLADDGDVTLALINKHREEIIQLLRAAQLLYQKEKVNNELLRTELHVPEVPVRHNDASGTTEFQVSEGPPTYSPKPLSETHEEDDIPF